MKIFLLFSSIFFSINCLCQIVVPKSIRNAVAFIYVKDDSGSIVPNGTGFYIKMDKDSIVNKCYLVTAKHVLQRKNGTFFDRIYIKVPRLSDSILVFVPIKLELAGKNKSLFFDADPSVDVAVIDTIPDSKIYRIFGLSSTYLITKSDFDSLGITEGHEVFFTGMFTQYLGDKANYPITRFGRVSLVTTEKVFWNGMYRHLYLLEASTYWGNSGAPVFFAIQKPAVASSDGLTIEIPTETPIKLAGIMSGMFGDYIAGIMSDTTITKVSKPYSWMNFGISAVTPSYLLRDILFSDELRRKRGF